MQVYPPSAKYDQIRKSRDPPYLLHPNGHLCVCPKRIPSSLHVQRIADDLELGAFPGLTPTDRENLAGGDENFNPLNWDDLKEIIGSLYLDSLECKPV